MAQISTWSTSAASNNAATPDGWPEGQAPSSVNNCGREMMAAIRTWYESAEWINLGHTPTKVDGDTFTLSGDLTTTYVAGRRVKMTGSATAYATILSSSYSAPNTTVNLTTSAIPATLSTVSVGILTPATGAQPDSFNFLAQRITANQALLSASTSTLVFNSETSDPSGSYDPTTGIYTAAADGVYLFSASVRLQNNAINAVTLTDVSIVVSSIGSIALGGFTANGSINAASNAFVLGGSCVVFLSAADTAQVQATVGTITGGTFTFNISSFFSGARIR